MGRLEYVDQELRALIEDVIGAGLLANSPGLPVARRLAEKGFGALDAVQATSSWVQEASSVYSLERLQESCNPPRR